MKYSKAKEKLLQEFIELTEKNDIAVIANAFASYLKNGKTSVRSADGEPKKQKETRKTGEGTKA